MSRPPSRCAYYVVIGSVVATLDYAFAGLDAPRVIETIVSQFSVAVVVAYEIFLAASGRPSFGAFVVARPRARRGARGVGGRMGARTGRRARWRSTAPRLCAAATAVALALSSCDAPGDGGATSAGSPSSPPDDRTFREQVASLCEPVEDAHEALLESEDTAGLQAAVTRLNEAEAELVDAIGRLEPPDGAGEHFARYVDALERYTSAASDASAGSGDARARLTAAVEAARAGVGLEDAAATADVPDECPPPPGVDAHNTLFAARANLACFDIGTEMRAAGPFDAPATAREVVTALELGERVTAGIAAAVRSAATRQVDGLPVDDIIETSRRRFMALATLRTTFEKGNYAAYRAANRELRTVTAEADRLLLSVGLLECSKALGSLPL